MNLTPPPLDPDILRHDVERRLRGSLFGARVEVRATLGSTQDEARRLAQDAAPEGTLVWALEQTSGRGRLDRRWVSAAGAGLWFSLILRPRLKPADAGFIGIMAGVATAVALRRRTGADVRLKWPNDLLVDGRKLGGILAEARVGAHRVEWVVLGIGINLTPPPGAFRAAHAMPATSLSETAPRQVGPVQLLASVLRELERRYVELRAVGPEPSRRRWLALSDTVGRQVRVTAGGRIVSGQATGMTPAGELVVNADGREVSFGIGEVDHLR